MSSTTSFPSSFCSNCDAEIPHDTDYVHGEYEFCSEHCMSYIVSLMCPYCDGAACSCSADGPESVNIWDEDVRTSAPTAGTIVTRHNALLDIQEIVIVH